jgi:hypothetical protein
MALDGIARVGDADTFRPAWWFQPFGLTLRDFLASQDFQTLVNGLRPAATATLNRTYEPLALADEEPKDVLLGVAPTFHSGLAVLLRPAGETNEIMTLWPFVTDGTQLDEVAIDEVVLAPNRLEAMIVGTLPSGARLTWHDVFFATDRVFYGAGSVHSVLLAGLVHELLPVQDAAIEIPADNPAWSAVRARFPEGFNPDGSATVQTRGMAALMPASPTSPEYHIVQGPVRRVEPHSNEMLGRTVHLVTVLAMREPDIELKLHVTDAVLDGRPLPEAGDDFSAAVRLVGRIWSPNVHKAAAER